MGRGWMGEGWSCLSVGWVRRFVTLRSPRHHCPAVTHRPPNAKNLVSEAAVGRLSFFDILMAKARI